jgi:hypothetical protein
MTPSGIEPATFRFVAQYLKHCATISGPRYINVVFQIQLHSFMPDHTISTKLSAGKVKIALEQAASLPEKRPTQ